MSGINEIGKNSEPKFDVITPEFHTMEVSNGVTTHIFYDDENSIINNQTGNPYESSYIYYTLNTIDDDTKNNPSIISRESIGLSSNSLLQEGINIYGSQILGIADISLTINSFKEINFSWFSEDRTKSDSRFSIESHNPIEFLSENQAEILEVSSKENSQVYCTKNLGIEVINNYIKNIQYQVVDYQNLGIVYSNFNEVYDLLVGGEAFIGFSAKIEKKEENIYAFNIDRNSLDIYFLYEFHRKKSETFIPFYKVQNISKHLDTDFCKYIYINLLNEEFFDELDSESISTDYKSQFNISAIHDDDSNLNIARDNFEDNDYLEITEDGTLYFSRGLSEPKERHEISPVISSVFSNKYLGNFFSSANIYGILVYSTQIFLSVIDELESSYPNVFRYVNLDLVKESIVSQKIFLTVESRKHSHEVEVSNIQYELDPYTINVVDSRFSSSKTNSDNIQFQYKEELLSIIDFITDYLPLTSIFKDMYGVILGRDFITDNEISKNERLLLSLEVLLTLAKLENPLLLLSHISLTNILRVSEKTEYRKAKLEMWKRVSQDLKYPRWMRGWILNQLKQKGTKMKVPPGFDTGHRVPGIHTPENLRPELSSMNRARPGIAQKLISKGKINFKYR